MFNKQSNYIQKVLIKENKRNSTYDRINQIDAYKAMYSEISWMRLLRKIISALSVPFIAAKYELITRARAYFKNRPLPWFKLSLILLFAYMIFQKEWQFQMNMRSPTHLFSEEDEEEKEAAPFSMTNLAQAARFSPEKLPPSSLAPIFSDREVKAYIDRFTKVALMEMQKYNIPASIKMGQAILASRAGKNALAVQYNNHFGILCKGQKNACQRVSLNDQTILINSYQSAWESWRAHSKLLAEVPFVQLQQYGKNYKKWAAGLEQMGYGNGENYSNKLIQTIETYKLYKLDELNEHI